MQPVQSKAVLDYTDVQIYSTNSSYFAYSTYTIVLNNLPKEVPIVSYMKIIIPDCFGLNFTNLAIRYGKSDGSIDFEIPY